MFHDWDAIDSALYKTYGWGLKYALNNFTTRELYSKLADVDPESLLMQKIRIRSETNDEKISEFSEIEREIWEEWRDYYYTDDELLQMEVEKAQRLMNYLENRE